MKVVQPYEPSVAANILGISAFYHDSAAALIRDGLISAAAQEERFTRIKHDRSFPLHAIEYCLQSADLSIVDIDLVVFYEIPSEKFKRLVKTYVAFAPSGLTSFIDAIPLWLSGKLFQKRIIISHLNQLGHFDPARLAFVDHHMSHAASAFYPSPFTEASILTIDGVGENATTTIATGVDSSIQILQQINFPHSLGMLYSAFTYFLGFKVNSGEYKVMGLAPYGEPVYHEKILNTLVDLKPDGSFRLDQRYFNYCTGLTMTNQKFERLFNTGRRQPESELTQQHFDIAASIQSVTETIVLAITRHIRQSLDNNNLCMAGGVALNCVANGKVLRDGQFDNLWVQPAAGDAGNAIGAAMAGYHQIMPRLQNSSKRRTLTDLSKPANKDAAVNHPAAHTIDSMQGSYLGPEFTTNEVKTRLRQLSAKFHVLQEKDLINTIANTLNAGKVVGWFQGRMEFGPRALGNRSILADPRSPQMQKTLNLKVKYRESFRPFAPSVLSEDTSDWFDLSGASPYMQIVADVNSAKTNPMSEKQQALFGLDKLNVPRSTIPAVTHVDYTARIQTVHKETNPRYHALISAFKSLTGCPLLVNTSFNVRGEPIVCTPEDAFHCFLNTEMDALVIEDCLLYKTEQTVPGSSIDRLFTPD